MYASLINKITTSLENNTQNAEDNIVFGTKKEYDCKQIFINSKSERCATQIEVKRNGVYKFPVCSTDYNIYHITVFYIHSYDHKFVVPLSAKYGCLIETYIHDCSWWIKITTGSEAVAISACENNTKLYECGNYLVMIN